MDEHEPKEKVAHAQPFGAQIRLNQRMCQEVFPVQTVESVHKSHHYRHLPPTVWGKHAEVQSELEPSVIQATPIRQHLQPREDRAVIGILHCRVFAITTIESF